MAPRPVTLESAVETADEPSLPRGRDDRSGLGIVLFVGCSVVAHAVGWTVLSVLPIDRVALASATSSFDFEVFDPEPLPEPVVDEPVEPEPEPEPVVAPPPREEREEVREPEPEELEETPAPVGEDPEEEPAPEAIPTENVGVTSTEGGLAVDAREGGEGTGPLALRPRGGRPDGARAGEGEAPAPAIDHRRLAREWMARVNRVIMERAIRDYPRAARRAHLEGTVVVSISVAPDGRITGVTVARSAENETLDRAAIAAVQAVGTLPEPPAIFTQRGRPLTMPISYRFQ